MFKIKGKFSKKDSNYLALSANCDVYCRFYIKKSQIRSFNTIFIVKFAVRIAQSVLDRDL